MPNLRCMIIHSAEIYLYIHTAARYNPKNVVNLVLFEEKQEVLKSNNFRNP